MADRERVTSLGSLEKPPDLLTQSEIGFSSGIAWLLGKKVAPRAE